MTQSAYLIWPSYLEAYTDLLFYRTKLCDESTIIERYPWTLEIIPSNPAMRVYYVSAGAKKELEVCGYTHPFIRVAVGYSIGVMGYLHVASNAAGLYCQYTMFWHRMCPYLCCPAWGVTCKWGVAFDGCDHILALQNGVWQFRLYLLFVLPL